MARFSFDSMANAKSGQPEYWGHWMEPGETGYQFQNPKNNALVTAAGWNLGTVRNRGGNAAEYLRQGYGGSRSFLSQMAGQYDPILARSTQGANMYANAMGLNGTAAQKAARGAFQTSPGYQFQVDEALQGAARAASAGGMLSSGNLVDASTRIASGLANQEYNNWLSRLAGYENQNLAAAQGKADAYGRLADTEYGYGTDRAGIESAIAEGEMGAFNQYGSAIQQQEKEEKDRKAALINGLLGLAGKGLGFLGGMLSDRRTKTGMIRIGTLPNGIPWYRFRYIHEGAAAPWREGVMADEVEAVAPEAVVTRDDGIKFVRYDMIL